MRERIDLIFALALVAGWAAVVGLAPEKDLYGALATYAGVVVASIAFRRRRELRAWFRVDLRVAAWGIGGAIVLILLTHGAYAVLTRLFPPLATAVAEQYATRGPGEDEQRVSLMLLVILAEEVLWRGQVIEAIDSVTWRRYGPLVSWVSYVLVQIPLGTGVVMLLAAGCGAFWTLQRIFARSVVAPLVTHVVWNLVLLVLWPVSR